MLTPWVWEMQQQDKEVRNLVAFYVTMVSQKGRFNFKIGDMRTI